MEPSLDISLFTPSAGSISSSSKKLYDAKPLSVYKPRKTVKTERSLLFDPWTEEDQKKLDILNKQIVSFWKTKVALHVVVDHTEYQDIGSFPPIARGFTSFTQHYQEYYPIIYLNTLNVIQDGPLIPINDTIDTLPISIDFSLIKTESYEWYKQLEATFKMHDSMGTSGKELEDIKGMFLGNPYLLYLTGGVALFHLLFDFLAFKNDVSFWRNRKNLVGLSFQTVFMNVISSTIVFFYLLDNDTSTLVLASVGVGLLVEIWKLVKAFGFSKNIQYQQSPTRVYDQMAGKYLGIFLIPVVICYAIYSLVYNKHTGYYSWFISSLVSMVYALGFVRMTPQLFINYKMKSVAHLPWRVFIYKAINTFIDDLFAFIIKMPTMHRLSCFRDDIVFLIYLYQRWIYDVDYTRENEYGQTPEKHDDSVQKKEQ